MKKENWIKLGIGSLVLVAGSLATAVASKLIVEAIADKVEEE